MASLPLHVVRKSSKGLLRSLSSTPTRRSPPNSVDEDATGEKEAGGSINPSQPFVRMQLEQGEWDPKRQNPIYRPKFKSIARIASADDFANRPTVGFTGEFQSLQDAMMVLTWMTQEQQKEIYQIYVPMMKSVEGSTTSHEYTMRALAQKFNITPERAAAVVQLQHNEEQIVRQGGYLCTDLANYMDQAIQKEIDAAYKTFNQTKPKRFAEDPVGVDGQQESKQYVVTDDLMDVDHMTQESEIRDAQRARRILDGHLYVEDVDLNSVQAPLDTNAKKLLQRAQEWNKNKEDGSQIVQDQRAKQHAVEPKWRNERGDGTKRNRYKYMAQTIHTKRSQKMINNSPQNTLVELDGELRPATLEEMTHVAWKATRHVQEHIYENVKKGWLDKVNRNQNQAWGKAPPPPPETKAVEAFVSETTDETAAAAAKSTDEAKESETAVANETVAAEAIKEGNDTQDEVIQDDEAETTKAADKVESNDKQDGD